MVCEWPSSPSTYPHGWLVSWATWTWHVEGPLLFPVRFAPSHCENHPSRCCGFVPTIPPPPGWAPPKPTPVEGGYLRVHPGTRGWCGREGPWHHRWRGWEGPGHQRVCTHGSLKSLPNAPAPHTNPVYFEFIKGRGTWDPIILLQPRDWLSILVAFASHWYTS